MGSTVPNLEGRFLEGTTGTPRSFKNAGLPNITGTTATSNDLNFYTHVFTGAFYWSYDDNSAWNANDRDGVSVARIGFDASRCSPIYGASDTVQPASYTVRYYIKAA